MPITTEIQIIIFIIIALIALIAGSFIFTHRSRNRAEADIRKAFGREPSSEEEDLSYLTSFYELKSATEDRENLIDSITWNDLSMDAVFRRINVCASSVGEEYLYDALHDLKSDFGDIEKRELLMNWLEEHPKGRVDLQRILLGLGKSKHNGLSTFLFYAEGKRLAHGWIYLVLGLLPLIGLLLLLFSPSTGIFILITTISVNSFVYTRKKLMLDGELETMQYFSALLNSAKLIQRHYGKEMTSLGLNFEGVLKPFRKTGGFIPAKMQGTASDLGSLFLAFRTIFLSDLILYNRTVNQVIRYTEELRMMFSIVGELDMAICVTSYRHSLSLYCTPEFRQDNIIRFSEVYHPLLRNPVTNSGVIDNDSIITGSNASGKSTFIKTIAINHILAQTINTCCAKSYTLGFSYIASSMALKDDILSGDSYFITEIKSLKRIIQYCKERCCLCFIDEILRGTNTPERIAASTAVLKLLHEMDSLCLVASHDIELTKILGELYDNYHFGETFEDDNITFDYLLKEGPSRSTNAIRLLKYMGFDQRIVEEAMNIVETNTDLYR